MTTTSPTALARARSLELPSRDEMLRRDPAVQDFWLSNRQLLHDAWSEWETGPAGPGPLDASLIHPDLREAVTNAWTEPSTEAAVRSCWTQVAPGVFQTQFFDPERLADLRRYLDLAADAQIPLRPPYGIVLNRGGAMLDRRSEGYLAAPDFQAFYAEILDRYMRPIARLLYPEVVGFDTQTFGFSINYQPSTDTSIRPHTDASSVTLNINMNLPDETYSGSAVDFFDPGTDTTTSLSFTPGSALIHRGHAPHMAHPITEGQRSNLVLWLYGDGMQTPRPGAPAPSISPQQRWTMPDTVPDGVAPF
ncbi:MAG: 2OG-Fe(II) oxygenase [Actinomycetota bacterium]